MNRLRFIYNIFAQFRRLWIISVNISLFLLCCGCTFPSNSIFTLHLTKAHSQGAWFIHFAHIYRYNIVEMNNTVRQSNSHNDQLATHTNIYEHERTHLLHIFVFYYQHKALILHLQMIVELEGGMVHYILPFIQFKLNTDQNEIQLWTFYICIHRENIHIAMWTNRLLWTSSTLLIWSHKCGNEQFHLYSSKMLKTIIMQNSLSLFSPFLSFIILSAFQSRYASCYLSFST